MDREAIQDLIRATPTTQPLPCPFCGTSSLILIEHSPTQPGTFEIYCSYCDTLGPRCYRQGKEAAIIKWNTRHNPTPKKPLFVESYRCNDCGAPVYNAETTCGYCARCAAAEE